MAGIDLKVHGISKKWKINSVKGNRGAKKIEYWKKIIFLGYNPTLDPQNLLKG
jgi:hypothetical protein